jgi:hypothetical protein
MDKGSNLVFEIISLALLSFPLFLNQEYYAKDAAFNNLTIA